MACNIRSNVTGVNGKVKGEHPEGYSGAVHKDGGGEAELQHSVGDMKGLEEYFTYMDLNWQQLYRIHSNVTIPALQDIILASWKVKVRSKESNDRSKEPNKDQSEGTQAINTNLRVKKKELKSKNVLSYTGDGLVNPYFQKMIDSVDPTDTANSDICNSEIDDIYEDEEIDNYQDIDWSSVTRPAQRKSKMWEPPYIRPPRSDLKVHKKFPRCAELMANNSKREKMEVVHSVQLDNEKQNIKEPLKSPLLFSIETVDGPRANAEKVRVQANSDGVQASAENVGVQANAEKVGGQANTEKVGDQANTEKVRVQANTVKNLDNGFDDVAMIDEVGSQTSVSTIGGNINKEKSLGLNFKGKHECKKCKKTFVQLGSLKSHKCDADAGYSTKIPCPSCSKLISRSNISHHLKVHASGHFLKCKKCNLTFRNVIEKKEHMLLHSKHTCNYCGKEFKRPCLLNRHVAADHRDEHFSDQDIVDEAPRKSKEYTCHYCKSVFPSISSLKTHLNKEHKRDGKKCSDCDNVFFSKRGLREHLKTHASVKEQEEPLEPHRAVIESSHQNVVIQVLQQVDAETATFEEIAISEFDPSMLS